MSEIFDRWMPFYINDFFGSYAVQCMSERAQLLYLRALCMQWQHGNLPADLDKLQRILGKGVKGFDDLWREVAPCFDLVDGRLVNQRCAKERAKAVSKSESSAAAARAKHANSERSANALRTHSDRTADALPIQDRTVQDRREEDLPLTPSAEGEPTKRKKRKRAAEPWQDVLERPEYARLRLSPAFASAWEDWIAHCGEAGSKADAPSGKRAAAMFNEAAKHPDRYAQAIEQAIRSNWQAPHVEALQRQQAATVEPRNAAQRNLDVIRNSARQLGLLTERLS